jgi:hypothetical protein
MSDTPLGYMPGAQRKAVFHVKYSMHGAGKTRALDQKFDSLLATVGFVCAGSLFVSLVAAIGAVVFDAPSLLLLTALGCGVVALTISAGEMAQKRHRAGLLGENRSIR